MVRYENRKNSSEVKVEPTTAAGNTLKSILVSFSSSSNYKQQCSNIINENRNNMDMVDLTIDLCDKIY